MKKGCLFLLLILVGMSGFYYWLLQSTPLSDKWWIPLLLAFGLTITIANIQGIFQAIRRLASSKRHPRDWKDGELVGASGIIQALRHSIKAPFSQKDCVMVEFEIKRVSQGSESNSTVRTNEVMGWLMTPCGISTARGQVKLVGFPLLHPHHEEVLRQQDNYVKAAEYIATTEFKDLPKNPLVLLKEISTILNDDDGDLSAHYKVSSSFPDKEVGAILPELNELDYELVEKTIPQGAEVTVFGTYSAKRQAIDIGSGFQNIDHTIEFGKIGKLIAKNFRAGIIGTLIFGGITAAGHWYVLKLLGLA